MLRIKLIAIFTILIFLSACKDEPSNQENIKSYSNVVSEFGSYELGSNGQVVLEVESLNNHVAYSLDINGERLIEEKPDSSIYGDWLFYWEEEFKRLWFYSGDIGAGVWERENSSKYTFKLLKESSEVLDLNETPNIIRQKFPRTVRERFWPNNAQ